MQQGAVRLGWGLVLVAVACGTERSGLDVPLARDCALPSAQLSICGPEDEACRAALDAALRCYADVDPGPPPRLTLTSSSVLEFPKLWLNPLGDRALAVLRVQRPAPNVSVVLSSTVGGVATVKMVPSGDPYDDLPRFAAGLALAHELMDRGGLQRFLAAPSPDAQAGLGVLLAGRADLYASFAFAGARGLAYDGSLARSSLAEVLWPILGEPPVQRRFREGGDPEVARLFAAAPGLLELLSSVDPAAVRCPRALTELDLGLVRVPAPMRVVGAVPAACAVLSLAEAQGPSDLRAGLLALVEDEEGRDLLVWAARLSSEDTILSLGLPPDEAVASAAGSYVHVYGRSASAQAVADATLRALGGL